VPLIYKKGRREVSRFKRKKKLVVKRHLTFLLRKEYKVATSVLFYKVKEEKHSIIKKVILSNYLCTTS